jgi:hypothetical protein
MDMPPGSIPIQLDAAGHLDADLKCIRCGYNLRGLPANGACPECGTAVGRSFLGDLLQFSPPEWVDQLAGGMNWILVGVVVSIVVSLLGGLLGGRRGADPVHQYLLHALGFISVIGYWMIAAPDPARLETEPSITARKLVRFVAVFSYVAGFALTGIGRMGPILAQTTIAGAGLIGIVGFFADFIYLRQLALRIPDLRLANQTRIVMWGLVVSMGLVIAGGIMTAALVASGSSPIGAAIVVCPTALGMVVFAIWSLILMVRFRRELSDAARLARQTWARPVGQASPVPPTWQ